METSCWTKNCAENHAPALGLLISMRLLVDVRLLTRLHGSLVSLLSVSGVHE